MRNKIVFTFLNKVKRSNAEHGVANGEKEKPHLLCKRGPAECPASRVVTIVAGMGSPF